MRTLLGHPEPRPYGTVYTSTGRLPLDNTLVDVRLADLFPAARTATGVTATTRGWISFSRGI